MQVHLVFVLLIPGPNILSKPLSKAGPPPIRNHLQDEDFRHLEGSHTSVVKRENPILPVVGVSMLVMQPRAVKRRHSGLCGLVMARIVSAFFRIPVRLVEKPSVRNQLRRTKFGKIVNESSPGNSQLASRLENIPLVPHDIREIPNISSNRNNHFCIHPRIRGFARSHPPSTSRFITNRIDPAERETNAITPIIAASASDAYATIADSIKAGVIPRKYLQSIASINR